jgi:FkbM family methyltransferase
MDEVFDSRTVAHAKVAEVPWFFRLGRFLAKHRLPGGYRLISEARRWGLLDRLALYSLNGIELRVPLWRPCNEWDADDVHGYEAPFMAALRAATRSLPQQTTLIDCGADIGTVTAHLVSSCRNISRAIAFEPNAAAYKILAENLDAMPIQTSARYAAVGAFSGRGRLVSDQDDPSAHAMYIEPCETGPVEVESIDGLDLPPGGGCVIKIDVEGAEASVIAGAMRTIRDASAVVVAFEAHPRVARRTGEDPIMMLRALRALRPDFVFTVDKAPRLSVRLDAPLFEQIPPTARVFNVIAQSGP